MIEVAHVRNNRKPIMKTGRETGIKGAIVNY